MTSLGARAIAVSVCMAAIAFACKKAPQELAPVKPGDFLEYKFTHTGGNGSSYVAQLKIEPGKSANTFVISGEPSGNEPPVEVDGALDAGRRIKIHFVGMLWLPPALRVVGAATRVGQVKRLEKIERREVWVVEEADKWPFYYDQATGFLVGYSQTSGGAVVQAQLLRSSIPAL